MNTTSYLLGKKGELIAIDFLKKNNYQILQKNFRTRFGEIDIIAKHDEKIHFIEVKTRVGIIKGYPYESVNFLKQKKVKSLAEIYVLKTEYKKNKLSFDVISIILDKEGRIKRFDFFDNIY